jgi:phage terminase large subunit-like protein
VIDLPTWQAHDARIKAAQVPDGPPLLDRLPRSFVEALTPAEALALKYEPRAYLRARQLPPPDLDWLTWALLTGRSWGKSFAAAAWIVEQLRTPGDAMLIAPTIDQCWTLQWDVLKAILPPWLRYVERVARGQIIFPDTGARLLLWSAQNTQLRGFNLKAAWAEELQAWPGGRETWSNLTRALRVKGTTPARAVATFTPPRELSWVLDLCAQPTTRVTRGTARDNTANDPRNVDAWYAELEGTIEGARELDGEVVLGVDGALFELDALERDRVAEAPAHFDRVCIAVDPAQSGSRDADTVGIVALGIRGGHLYVLASSSERMAPALWAERAITWADRYTAGVFCVEPTGSGGYPRATIEAATRIAGVFQRPIVDSHARGSKADRAMPLSAASAAGRLHLVGRHPALERELTTWFPGANFSPGALDALVHGASLLTHNWIAIR